MSMIDVLVLKTARLFSEIARIFVFNSLALLKLAFAPLICPRSLKLHLAYAVHD